MRMDWKEIIVEPLTPPSFRTHSNYISCLNNISQNLRISHNFRIDSKIKKNPEINKKLNLIKLIKKSLDREYYECSKNEDFSEICCIWIPVKSYYLLFNVWLLLNNLIVNTSLNLSHIKVHNNLKQWISIGNIKFNEDSFNKIYPHKEILEFKTKPGEVLRSDADPKRVIKSLLKKVVQYKVEDVKRKEKIKDFRTKKAKKIKAEILKDNVHLCEFFYWYRIKANYRDLEFLNQEISSREFFQFYKNYFELTNNFYNVFKELINEIAIIRFGKELIK